MQDDDDFEDSWYEKTKRVHQQRRSAPYDGVLGELPDWVPKRDQEKFYTIRNRLLDDESYGDKPTPELIRAWINDHCELVGIPVGEIPGGEDGWSSPVPEDVFDDVAYLAELCYAVSLGEEAGLRRLAGEMAVFGLRHRRAQSEKAKKRRGKIGDQDDSTTLSGIIESLATAPEFEDYTALELWPEFYSELDERGLDPDEIENPSDPNKTEITYDSRGTRRGMTFGTFANAVSKYRKPTG